MISRSHALFVTVLVGSTLAAAESRFTGSFDSRGMGVLVDTGPSLPEAQVNMPPGHLNSPDFDLPMHTRERFNPLGKRSLRDITVLDDILTEANQRFATHLKELRQDQRIVRAAKAIAPLYHVDPAAVVASVLAELTFNNPYSTKFQDYAASATILQSFYPGAAVIKKAMELPQMRGCKPERGDYWSWLCADRVWGSNVLFAKGRSTHRPPAAGYIPLSPNVENLATTISPQAAIFKLGVSFGPAQITLFRALMASDDVTRVSGGKFPRLTIDNMPAVQRMVGDIEGSMHIVSATIARSMYAYRKYARVDVSENLGLLASLFNLGYEVVRANQLAQSNTFKDRNEWNLPRENYFGWFANEHEKEIRSLIDDVR